MKIHVVRCKICKNEVRLQIADEYEIEHDPSKLTRMATCNRCFDLRKHQMKIEDAIKVVCHNLVHVMTKDEQKARGRELLRKLLKQFSQWCSDVLNRQHAANVGSLGDRIIADPKNWWKSLREFETEANES